MKQQFQQMSIEMAQARARLKELISSLPDSAEGVTPLGSNWCSVPFSPSGSMGGSMNKVYCERFEYISCRGNRSIDFEIRKPRWAEAPSVISTIVQFEENCPKRVMKNVGSGYLFCSFDLIRFCDPTRIIDSIRRGWFEISENEEEHCDVIHL